MTYFNVFSYNVFTDRNKRVKYCLANQFILVKVSLQIIGPDMLKIRVNHGTGTTISTRISTIPSFLSQLFV